MTPRALALAACRAVGLSVDDWIPVCRVGAVVRATTARRLLPSSKHAGAVLVARGLLRAVRTPTGHGARVRVDDLGELLARYGARLRDDEASPVARA